jgi:hypothetical protein
MTTKRMPGLHELTRRTLLQTIFARGTAERERIMEEPEVPGRFRLSSLKFLPDSVLLQIVPVLREGWTARLCDDGVAYRTQDGGSGLVHLPPECRMAVALFDGKRTLEQVTQVLLGDQSLPANGAWLAVREAFLGLAAQEVYHPAAPPKPCGGSIVGTR